jgi:hypothetical protein
MRVGVWSLTTKYIGVKLLVNQNKERTFKTKSKTTESFFSTTSSSIKDRGRPSRTLSDSDDTTPLRKLHN